MPYKSLAQERKCKWCNNPTKKYFSKKTGFFKGYLRTCGNSVCLKVAQKDKNVRISKRFHQLRVCEGCKKEYDAKGFTARWCKKCVPTKASGAIMRRYGVSKPQWDSMFVAQDGKCKLCSEIPKVVDHNHQTGEVRSLLCYGCNLLVGLLERDKDWINKALNYV